MSRRARRGTSGWLIADVGVACSSVLHAAVVFYAWIAVLCYPVGLLLLNACLLFMARGALQHADQAQAPEGTLARAIDFLYREYQPQFCWWELGTSVRLEAVATAARLPREAADVVPADVTTTSTYARRPSASKGTCFSPIAPTRRRCCPCARCLIRSR